jgi:bifunctional enzyme CysN/CysC
MAKKLSRQTMNIVIAGHVDHGKSTVIGRLLADTGSLPEGKLEQVRRNCEINSKPFEYAFLLDALKDEQSQGITIDSARVFFHTKKRDYIIIDAPGHIEFLKNMVTGASRAEAAILVIDADEGVQENSRRHGYLISMLGIKQIVVVVNKMDLVDYSEDVYGRVVAEYKKFLEQINLDSEFIPVSGVEGDNVASNSDRMPWYKGITVLDAIDSFSKEPPPVAKPFRMPVQDVYKFTKAGDNRRIVAGTIDTGEIKVGDEVVFYPSKKKSTVKTIEAFNRPAQSDARAGMASAFTLDKQIYISRGELAAINGQPEPKVTNRLRVNLFWMGRNSLTKDKIYHIKTGTARVECRLEDVIRVIDGSDLDTSHKKEMVEYHDVAECVIETTRPLAFDLAEDIASTGRFVIVDDYEIRGGGIIREALEEPKPWMHEYVRQRNYKWETSAVSRDDRSERYSQKPTLLLVTGQQGVGRKDVAKALEARLFLDGKIVYFLGIGNVLYGVDADIKQAGDDPQHREEHLRRLAEVANIILDAGMILIVTAVGLTQGDLDMIKTAVDTESVYVLWVGSEQTDINYDMLVPQGWKTDETIDAVKGLLCDNGVIFRPL